MLSFEGENLIFMSWFDTKFECYLKSANLSSQRKLIPKKGKFDHKEVILPFEKQSKHTFNTQATSVKILTRFRDVKFVEYVIEKLKKMVSTKTAMCSQNNNMMFRTENDNRSPNKMTSRIRWYNDRNENKLKKYIYFYIYYLEEFVEFSRCCLLTSHVLKFPYFLLSTKKTPLAKKLGRKIVVVANFCNSLQM